MARTILTACAAAVLRNSVSRKTLDDLGREGIQMAVLGCNHHLVLYRPFVTPDIDDRSLFSPRRQLLPTGF